MRAIIGWPPPRDDQAMAQALPTAFNQESAGDQVVPLGSGKWWGRVLVPNNGPNKDSHPYKCALGCGYHGVLSHVTFTLRILRVITFITLRYVPGARFTRNATALCRTCAAVES